MSKMNKKSIVTAALVGGTIFCLVVLFVDYLFGRTFEWTRLGFYFLFGVIMYGFLTYRNFKKHNKDKNPKS